MQYNDITILQCDKCGFQQISSTKADFYGFTVVKEGRLIHQMEICGACLKVTLDGLDSRRGLCNHQLFRASPMEDS